MSPVKVVVLASLVGIGFWIALVAALRADDLPGLVLNLGTELMGAGVIYFILDHVIGGRERREIGGRERREAKKRELIMQMGSRVRDVAIAAAEELRARGWLNDGSLQRANLVYANLEGARLMDAHFDENMRLPDGTKWTPDTAMAHFTDPDHPEFWRSDFSRSPAYKGREEEQNTE